jgi:hypothetical protein
MRTSLAISKEIFNPSQQQSMSMQKNGFFKTFLKGKDEQPNYIPIRKVSPYKLRMKGIDLLLKPKKNLKTSASAQVSYRGSSKKFSLLNELKNIKNITIKNKF